MTNTMRIDGVTRTRVPLGAAVPSLVRWGLSSDADLVFRTLTTFGSRTERTLAVELGLPARRTAEALAELRECGAAVSTTDVRAVSRIWTARRPAAVIDMLRSRNRRQIDPDSRVRSHREVMNGLRLSGIAAALPSSTVPGLPGRFAEGMRYLSSRAAARTRLAEVVGQDIHELWTMSPDQSPDAESARAAAPVDAALLDRGVRCRLLRPPLADGDRLDVSSHLVNGTSYQCYDSEDVPLRMLMVDRRVALIPADPRDLERGYFEFSGPAVMDALAGLFDRHWSSAVTRQQALVAPIQLSEREHALIALLATGHTDRTAADILTISPRSVTNMLRALMDRLGVENRFQLGLTLGALRVVTPPMNPES
ncbi:hypothetical protein Ahu01nite_024600 [Winogradskya humida]|uniref:HTH luxR-type domain-containing protein n=2 Tax=Winogradskya humida TaxID=113566 RepID=A0ABQ3ZLI3_9ACTN|nr:hypothetical protein Ahu01nite_024600 [Actinoplanes humidus]